MLEDLRLDPAIHDRQGFECGVPALNEYISRLAEQHRRRGISSVYVLTDSAHPEHILGYYTFSAAEVDGQRLSEAERKKLPRFPVPCFRMGRLACRSDQEGSWPWEVVVGLRRRSMLEGQAADCSLCVDRGCERRCGQCLLHALRIQAVAGRANDAVFAAWAIAQCFRTHGIQGRSGVWWRRPAATAVRGLAFGFAGHDLAISEGLPSVALAVRCQPVRCQHAVVPRGRRHRHRAIANAMLAPPFAPRSACRWARRQERRTVWQ